MFRFAVGVGNNLEGVLASADKPRTLLRGLVGFQDPDRAIISCTTAKRGSRAGGHIECRLVQTHFTCLLIRRPYSTT